jgi:hypothetical protein
MQMIVLHTPQRRSAKAAVIRKPLHSESAAGLVHEFSHGSGEAWQR